MTEPAGPPGARRSLTPSGGLLLFAALWMAGSTVAAPPWGVWLALTGLALAWAGLGSAWLRVPTPRFGEIVLWAVLARLPGIWVIPGLEDDFWRYLWDGHLLATTGSPYGIAPAEWLGRPGVPAAFQHVLGGINHPELPTIYGPGVQGLFMVSGWIAAGSLWPLKLMLLGAEIALWVLLRTHLPARGMLLLAWCPLGIWETAFNAHFEAWPILLAVAAFLWASRGRGVWAGVALGMAIAARPFALVLAPFLIARKPAALPGMLIALVAAYGPVWAAGGMESLGAFASGWEFNSTAFALIQILLPPESARLLSAALFAVVCLVVWIREHRRRALLPRGDVIFGSLLLLSPVANPWYALWLVPFAAAQPRAWAWTCLAVIPISYVTWGNLEGTGSFMHPAWVRPLELGLVLLAAALAGGWRKLRGPGLAKGERG